jgi:hypothetical protein
MILCDPQVFYKCDSNNRNCVDDFCKAVWNRCGGSEDGSAGIIQTEYSGTKTVLLSASLELTFIMKSTVLWDVISCSPAAFHHRFGGPYCLHLQGRRVTKASNQ